jgi:CRP-like cAMP-binding protein
MSEQTKELPSPHAGSAMMPPPEQLPVPTALKPRLVKISQINFRKIPLLANLTDEELNRLQADLRIRKFSRREIVLQKGATGDSLLFVLVGQLQVVDVTEDGRAIGLRMLAPGDFFGEIAVINGSTRSASVLALTETLVGFLPSAVALHLFSHSPSVARLMLSHLAEKIQRDSEFRALLSIHNTSRRIYTFLQMFRKTLPDGSDVIDSLPTHQDVANMINTSRETVTRAILQLVQQGIVEKDTHRLIVRNPAEFQNLLRGTPT